MVKCICPNCKMYFFQIVKCICPNGGGKLWIWKVWNAVAEVAGAAFKFTPSLKPTEHLERKKYPRQDCQKLPPQFAIKFTKTKET